jgi:uncharacterized membrane protein
MATGCANLWAVGFDDAERAARARDEITWLGWEKHYFNLLDVALAVRNPDGCLTLNGDAFPIVTNLIGSTPASFLAGLARWVPPMTGPAVGAMLGEFGACAVAAGIRDDFVREVAGLIKPGTSVLLVLDDGGDIDAILPAIRGLGGTVLKTNVDLERAKLVQSTLADSADSRRPIGHSVPSERGES